MHRESHRTILSMGLVYHYTSIDAFQDRLNGIHKDTEKNKYFLTFWASSIYAMNDPMEFIYGFRLLWETVLPEIETSLGIADSELRLSKMWENVKGNKTSDEWNNILLKGIYESSEVPFVISFSRNMDFLPMWSAYSDRGRGVSLGFNDFPVVHKNMGIDNLEILHYLNAEGVSYGGFSDVAKKVINGFYEKQISILKNISDSEQRMRRMIDILSSMAVIAAPYHKHKAYEYEQESRLIITPKTNKDIKYRKSRNGSIIPFIEVPIPLSFLVKVIIGPCADSISIMRELKRQLNCFGVNTSEMIAPSEIPYRKY